MSRCRSFCGIIVWDSVLLVSGYLFPSFPRFGKFSAIISSNTFSVPLSLSSPSGTPLHINWHLYIIPEISLPCFFFFFVFLGLCPWHMEIPRLGVESEMQLLSYATATQGLSHVCDLCQSVQQHQILHLLSKARDRSCILMDASGACNLLNHKRDASLSFVKSAFSLLSWLEDFHYFIFQVTHLLFLHYLFCLSSAAQLSLWLMNLLIFSWLSFYQTAILVQYLHLPLKPYRSADQNHSTALAFSPVSAFTAGDCQDARAGLEMKALSVYLIFALIFGS